MIKKESNNFWIFVSTFLAIALILVFAKYYFVDAIIKKNEKKEVSISEQNELKLLVQAYLNQNYDLSLKKFFLNKADENSFAVAAEYYYLKNGLDHLNEYDKILELAKTIFDDEKIKFSNFSINVDSLKCGKEKYSTLEGLISQDICNQTDIVYEISDIYSQNDSYIVEFFASKAEQIKIESEKSCNNFEIPLSYKLKITDLYSVVFYEEDSSRCCIDDCHLEGIEPLKKEILNQIKIHNYLYKMIFIKKNNSFVFYQIKQ